MVTEPIKITPSGSAPDYSTLPRDITEETTQEVREIEITRTVTPHRGALELCWLYENQDTVANYSGLWIAILGELIIASEPTFEEIHDRVLEMGLPDALIVRVPDDMAQWNHLLA